MPKEKQKPGLIEGKGKKFIPVVKGKGGKSQPFGPSKPIATKPVILPPDAPAVPVSKTAKRTGERKWCLKNTQVFHAVVERSVGEGRSRTILSTVIENPRQVFMHTVVTVLKQNISTTWSAVSYETMAVEVIDAIKRTRDRVTTRVTGWVQNAHLNDYVTSYPDAEVLIPHATPTSTDAQQYMTLEIDEEEKKFKHVIRHNMCGELCVAYVAKKDIDTLLTDWKAKPGNFFRDRLGMGKDLTTGPGILKDILDIYFPPASEKKLVEPYIETVQENPPRIEKIPLEAPNDPSRASDEFRAKIRTHDFITLVQINTTTGELVPAVSSSERNHWVVVTRVMRGGYRVELYNPFPNRRQAYTFSGFFASAIGASVMSGWWVKRKRAFTERPYSPPALGIAANHPTSSTIDAEQYVFIEGGGVNPKTMLCGQFSTAYIIASSLDRSLQNWKARQKKQPASLWELNNMLDAYGFNNADGKRLFSIDTLLRYWKKVQPNLYAATVGGNTNEGTGFLELTSILRAYGYRREDMFERRPDSAEPFLFSPERDAKALKKYILIAGVIISGRTGRLKNKIGGGVEHWVVVNSITPEENQRGGGGGWVELYNPFPNAWEEYTCSEFVNAFNGGTLWVKKDVTPVFTPEVPAPPKAKIKPNMAAKPGQGGKAKGKAAAPALGLENILREFNRLISQPKAVLGDVIGKLANLSGLDRNEIRRLVKTENDSGKPDVDVEKLLSKHLAVKSIPEAVTRWIQEEARGDETSALQLADALRRFGILIVKGNQCSLADLDKFNVSQALKAALSRPVVAAMAEGLDRHAELHRKGEAITLEAAGLAAKPFVSAAVADLKATIAKTAEEQAKNQFISRAKPVQGILPRDEYREWIKTVAAASDRLYRVRIWGDPVMSPLGFDAAGEDVPEGAVKAVGHFQAIGLYNNLNKEFGAISNHIDIKRDDIDSLMQMQLEQEFNGKLITQRHKMNWLCSLRGKIFMYDDAADNWETAQQIRWGTLALGGNLVQIDRFDEIETKLPGEKKKRLHRMGRLVGFRRKDWARPLDELLAEGLVHRCFCIYKNNGFGDVPNKGVVFSPLFSPKEEAWSFNGKKKLDALYIPEVYLEKKDE